MAMVFDADWLAATRHTLQKSSFVIFVRKAINVMTRSQPSQRTNRASCGNVVAMVECGLMFAFQFKNGFRRLSLTADAEDDDDDGEEAAA